MSVEMARSRAAKCAINDYQLFQGNEICYKDAQNKKYTL
ncbi:hypothetical protein VC87395_001128 [Vibrio paracholerae 87395]|nr:hypothetical protein VC87395_001128 [Vibrio paracholerae 87395]